MKVADWMVEIVHTCRPDDSLADAARTLREMDCGCLPIVNRLGAVVGILTDRDICMVAGDTEQGLDRVPISSLKIRPVITCHPEDDEARVLDLILTNQVRRLPVVNAEGGLLGIVSLGDLARLTTDGQETGNVQLTVNQVVEAFARFSRAKYRTRYSDQSHGPGLERSLGHDDPSVG